MIRKTMQIEYILMTISKHKTQTILQPIAHGLPISTDYTDTDYSRTSIIRTRWD